MKKLYLLLLLLALGGVGYGVYAARNNQVSPKYDLYLLIGQSNMAGRGKMLPTDSAALPGVWLLTAEGEVEPAISPLNKYSSIRKGLAMQQICPGNGFAETLYAATHRPILLVVNARGGSAIGEWLKGAEAGYYAEAVRRTQQASCHGELRAILWHQGESDSAHPEKYLQQLAALVDSLRHDLGCGNIPFIAGEIAPWHPNAERFNPMIHRIAESIPQSYWVSSSGCTPLLDESDPHFGREGQLLLGRRYAEKIIELNHEKQVK